MDGPLRISARWSDDAPQLHQTSHWCTFSIFIAAMTGSRDQADPCICGENDVEIAIWTSRSRHVGCGTAANFHKTDVHCLPVHRIPILPFTALATEVSHAGPSCRSASSREWLASAVRERGEHRPRRQPDLTYGRQSSRRKCKTPTTMTRRNHVCPCYAADEVRLRLTDRSRTFLPVTKCLQMECFQALL